MEEQIKRLIKEYEELIQFLKTAGRTKAEHFNNTISLYTYERVIKDLRAISEKTKDANKL